MGKDKDSFYDDACRKYFLLLKRKNFFGKLLCFLDVVYRFRLYVFTSLPPTLRLHFRLTIIHIMVEKLSLRM